MRVRLEDLPPDRLDQLRRIVQARGLGEGTHFRTDGRRWLAVMGVLCLGLGLASAWSLKTGVQDWPRPADAYVPWVGLLGLIYGPLALVEYVRVLRAEFPPFLLLTPFNLVKGRGSHRSLDIYRLSEARAFQRVQEYSGTKWTGQAYEFDFGAKERFRFVLQRKEDITTADRALALAQAAGRGEPLPDLPSCHAGDLGPGYARPEGKPGALEKVFDPASETWLLVLGFLCLGFIPYAIFR
jgi:hypothetical protein